ncbi:hypothetical protein M2145_001495 [Lachnospiraceae bacterium PF1-21]
MEKVIKLIMNEDKSICILVNEEKKHVIDVHNRSIAANEIFELFDFDIGNQYSVVCENTSSVDKQVLEFFAELFINISTKVNAIKDENDTLIDF